MIAYAVIAALRLLELKVKLTALAWLPYQAELARALGADEALGGGPPAVVEERLAKASGARRQKTVIGASASWGGFDVVYDCIGTRESLDNALTFTRSGGHVTLIGAAGILSKLDWTSVWYKELTLVGSLGYGREPAHGDRHTFEVLSERLASTALPLREAGHQPLPAGRVPRRLPGQPGAGEVPVGEDPARALKEPLMSDFVVLEETRAAWAQGSPGARLAAIREAGKRLRDAGFSPPAAPRRW